MAIQPWHPTSWHTKYYYQEINYPAPDAAEAILQKLATLPPLVTVDDVNFLKQLISQAALGNCFLLQGGDCAESFVHNGVENIHNKLTTITQMQNLLSRGLHKPVIPIGRIAGQFAKPRSAPYEIRAGERLLSYRGDLINDAAFSAATRIPEPERMLTGYHQSAFTLQKMHELTAPNDFYISHEALHLPYETALTRKLKNGSWYNLGTHFPWVGMLTARLNSAHIEYLRGIANPVAIKVGPNTPLTELKQMIELLNPNNELGRLTLVHRFGVNNINKYLPAFIELTAKYHLNVVWMNDPMHGNTQVTASGYKTRKFDDILQELQLAFHIHQTYNTNLSGIHFELAGEEVTECMGGPTNVTESTLPHAYKSLVDPRLNNSQALAIAEHIAAFYKSTRQKASLV